MSGRWLHFGDGVCSDTDIQMAPPAEVSDTDSTAIDDLVKQIGIEYFSIPGPLAHHITVRPDVRGGLATRIRRAMKQLRSLRNALEHRGCLVDPAKAVIERQSRARLHGHCMVYGWPGTDAELEAFLEKRFPGREGWWLTSLDTRHDAARCSRYVLNHLRPAYESEF